MYNAYDKHNRKLVNSLHFPSNAVGISAYLWHENPLTMKTKEELNQLLKCISTNLGSVGIQTLTLTTAIWKLFRSWKISQNFINKQEHTVIDLANRSGAAYRRTYCTRLVLTSAYDKFVVRTSFFCYSLFFFIRR